MFSNILYCSLDGIVQFTCASVKCRHTSLHLINIKKFIQILSVHLADLKYEYSSLAIQAYTVFKYDKHSSNNLQNASMHNMEDKNER